MMRAIVYILATATVITLFSCQKGKELSGTGSLDTVTAALLKQNNDEYKKLLQGVWASDVNSNALFEIKGDSLYYFEDPKPVYYEVKKDTFKVFIDHEVFASQIKKLTTDSLVRIEYGQVIKLYKR